MIEIIKNPKPKQRKTKPVPRSIKLDLMGARFTLSSDLKKEFQQESENIKVEIGVCKTSNTLLIKPTQSPEAFEFLKTEKSCPKLNSVFLKGKFIEQYNLNHAQRINIFKVETKPNSEGYFKLKLWQNSN